MRSVSVPSTGRRIRPRGQGEARLYIDGKGESRTSPRRRAQSLLRAKERNLSESSSVCRPCLFFFEIVRNARSGFSGCGLRYRTAELVSSFICAGVPRTFLCIPFLCPSFLFCSHKHKLAYNYILNSITSPSFTTYSLPSVRTQPFSRALAYEPASISLSYATTSARINFSLKSV